MFDIHGLTATWLSYIERCVRLVEILHHLRFKVSVGIVFIYSRADYNTALQNKTMLNTRLKNSVSSKGLEASYQTPRHCGIDSGMQSEVLLELCMFKYTYSSL